MGPAAAKKRTAEEAQPTGRGPRSEHGSDRFVAILLSVLVHGAIVGALLWGWWRYRAPPAPPTALAIQAAVVRASPVNQAATPPAIHPPSDQTRMDQQREAAQAKVAAAAAALAAQKAAAQKAAEEKAAAEAAAQAAAKVAADQAAAAQAAAQKAAQEQAAAEKAAAERQAREQAKLAAERKAKEQAEEKARAEAAREAQALAQQVKVEQAERARAADLQSQLQAEEKLDALQRGPEEEAYINAISAKISRAWVRPASAQPGTSCIIHLTQLSGGEVTKVQVEGCNGDEAVRQSVQTAAYRASPLPTPPDPALFDPNITVTFAPDQ